MHINSTTDGSVLTAVPVGPAAAGAASTASLASVQHRFWSTVEGILYYGLLGFGIAAPFVGLIAKHIQG